MYRFFLALGVLLSSPAIAEDLLSDDEFSFEPDINVQSSHTFLDDTKFTFEHSVAQGRTLQRSRSAMRVEYESAPWEGAYIRLDNKLSYFWHEDAQAQQQNTDYGHHKLDEAWFQYSKQACFAKLGRQTLFWGSVEGTFAVDLVSPFDYTEPLLTDFSSIRLAQDTVMAECFLDSSQLQFFVVPRARLDVTRHRTKGAYKDTEDELNEEWGARFIQNWEGLDIHLMYARLYANTPTVTLNPIQPLLVPRFDFVGLTLVKAIRRLLIEFDLGYRSDQIENFSTYQKDLWDLALGIEYTTANNHQWNAGLWLLDAQPSQPDMEFKRTEAWTMGWSNTYLNDDLTLSLLGSYIADPDQESITFQSRYKWDDYHTYSFALTYADPEPLSDNTTGGWGIDLNAKIEI